MFQPSFSNRIWIFLFVSLQSRWWKLLDPTNSLDYHHINFFFKEMLECRHPIIVIIIIIIIIISITRSTNITGITWVWLPPRIPVAHGVFFGKPRSQTCFLILVASLGVKHPRYYRIHHDPSPSLHPVAPQLVSQRFELHDGVFAWWCSRDGEEDGFVEVNPDWLVECDQGVDKS